MLSLFVATLILSQPSPSVQTDVVYRTVDGKSMMMDVYSPVSDEAKLPAVVVIHGGGWTQGKREDMADLCKALANEGFVAATVSYRLANATTKWPAMLDDVQSAVRYLRGNAAKYHIDPDRMGASGGSAGGHLALLLGLRDTRDTKTDFYPKISSRVSAVFNIFGPVDLSQDFNKAIAGVLCFQVVGKKYEDAGPEIKEFSPINYIDKKSPPIFTMHGTADELVPIKQAHRLDEAMKKAGREHVLWEVEGMGHNVDMSKPKVVEGLQKALQFLKEKLAKKPALQHAA